MSNKKNKRYDFSAISAWMQNYIAEVMTEEPDNINLEQSLDDLALDSMHVVRMAGDLEELLGGIEVESSLMYEYKTLSGFCKQLEVMHKTHLDRKEEQGEPLQVSICASFTSEPIEESVQYGLKSLGYAPTLSFAPYNQVFQELFNPVGTLAENTAGLSIILFRIEDWFRFEKDTVPEEKARKTVQEFCEALAHFTNGLTGNLIVGFCPHTNDSVRKLGISHVLEELDQEIWNACNGLPNVHCLDLKSLDGVYSFRRVLDDARDQIGHIPFTPEYFTAAGLEVVRKINAIIHPSAKVLVVDCDNTLWKGIAGEDGATGVQVTPAFQYFHRFLIKQKESGRVICLASKNNEDDVWEVFDRNEVMLLEKAHIVSAKINWKRKSQNIVELAAELNLGLDSFIFIDDNPSECEEVRLSLPMVQVIQFPKNESAIEPYFEHHWAFDTLTVTDEDRRRTELYQQNIEREAVRKTSLSYSDFLQQLNVEIEVSELSPEAITRAAQLTHRTNQFNTTTRRRTEAEVQQLAQAEDSSVFSVKVKDRFGDYGFVGMIVAVYEMNQLRCETFLMSCRVLGKNVEQTMIKTLSAEASKRNLETIVLEFKESEKNKPAKDFYTSFGLKFTSGKNGYSEIAFPVTDTGKVIAASRKEPVSVSSNQSGKKQINRGKVIEGLPLAYEKMAKVGGDVNTVIHQIRSGAKMKRGQLKTKFIAPRTAWQKKIAAIWSDILGIDRVGIYDSFFDLGGDSMRAAEAFARMWDLGVPDSISLINIPEPTVAMLCQAIEDVKAGKKPTLITDQFSLEDEGKNVAPDIRNEGYDIHSYDTPMKTVLLTGGTGYLGAFLIHELMEQTNVQVICLVRGATEEAGKARIRKNLGRYGIWKESYENRVEVLLGELTEPYLGIGEPDFNRLAKRINTIFHSGAWVNFVFPYQRLKPAHVDAIETMMRLATADKDKAIAFHFISTLGVIMSTGYGPDDIVYEDAPLEHVEGLLNGYEQAKHVADKMAYIGMKERGIPTAIYRPGMVGGIGATGEYHKTDEFLSSYYKGCIQLGSWPMLNTTWEVAPVEFITKAIVHGAKDPNNLNHAYFTLHPEPTMVSNYIRWFQDFGYPMRALPWEVWKRELISQGTEKLRSNSLFPFVDFIRALYEEQVRFPTTDRSNFKKLVTSAGLEVPSQLEILERYIRYFIKSGFIDAPLNGMGSNQKSKQQETLITA